MVRRVREESIDNMGIPIFELCFSKKKNGGCKNICIYHMEATGQGWLLGERKDS